MVSKLKNKSEILYDTAKLLHDKSLYVGVAHATYYSCYQLLKHIWLHSMSKSEEELTKNISTGKIGSHEYLLNEIVSYIEKYPSKTGGRGDYRIVRDNMLQLKRLRVKADYKDDDFCCKDSNSSITLSDKILPILRRY